MARMSAIGWAALLACGAGSTVSAQAQDSQRIEVTGSRIKRTDAETASPVQV